MQHLDASHLLQRHRHLSATMPVVDTKESGVLRRCHRLARCPRRLRRRRRCRHLRRCRRGR
jgi:hypothetical protein